MLELKYRRTTSRAGRIKAFNRTMLELKSCYEAFETVFGTPFNRTMLELKLSTSSNFVRLYGSF